MSLLLKFFLSFAGESTQVSESTHADEPKAKCAKSTLEATANHNNKIVQQVNLEDVIDIEDNVLEEGTASTTKSNKTDDEKAYFVKTLNKMIAEKLIPPSVMELKEIEGSYKVKCKPCSNKKERLINPGHKTKALSNVKAHIATPSHAKNVNAYLESMSKNKEGANLRSDSKVKVKTLFDEVKSKYPGQFELLEINQKSEAKIRCFTCNQVIILNPQRGSVFHNIGEHLEQHSKSKSPLKRKQQSLEGFWKPSKRPSTL